MEKFLQTNRDQWCSQCYNRPIHKISSPAEGTWKTKLCDLTFEPFYCQVSYHAPRPTRTLPHWIDDIHVSKQYQWVSQNTDDHILLSFFIILMNEKSVSISVYLENKTTIIRLSPCVHITFWTVTFRFLWMFNFIRHWRMLSHLCRIRVLWFP